MAKDDHVKVAVAIQVSVVERGGRRLDLTGTEKIVALAVNEFPVTGIDTAVRWTIEVARPDLLPA